MLHGAREALYIGAGVRAYRPTPPRRPIVYLLIKKRRERASAFSMND